MPVPTREVTLLDREDVAAAAVPAVQPPPAPDSVALMFERLARDPSVDVEKLARLIEMQERIMAHNSRAAFNVAFSEMQGEIPAIAEKGKTDKGTYARLEDIIERVRPILRKHGFTLSHRTEWPDAKTVRVVGILTHEQGHDRTSEFLSAADQSGSKNAIQALGSAVSYGRRYTTKDLLNIVTVDEDDNGARSEHYKQPEAPAGYQEWFDDMSAVADEGWTKLSQAYTASKPEFKAYAAKSDRQRWAALKARAQKVVAK